MEMIKRGDYIDIVDNKTCFLTINTKTLLAKTKNCASSFSLNIKAATLITSIDFMPDDYLNATFSIDEALCNTSLYEISKTIRDKDICISELFTDRLKEGTEYCFTQDGIEFVLEGGDNLESINKLLGTNISDKDTLVINDTGAIYLDKINGGTDCLSHLTVEEILLILYVLK